MKMNNKQRKEYYKQQLLEKKLTSLTHEDKAKLNELLDTMDAIDQSTEEGQTEYATYLITLNSFIDERYEKYYNASICNECIYCNSCYRDHTRKKNCNRFEKKEEEENEATDNAND